MRAKSAKRRRSLVVAHLEGINRDALEKYQDIVRDYVKGHEGIYALFRKSRLYYVGLAGNLRSRIKQHLKDKHAESWDRFSVYLTHGESHLKEMESLLIRASRPPGNKQKARFLRSEDLKGRFRRDIQRHQKDELEDLIGSDARPARRTPRVTNNSLTAVYAAGVRSIQGKHKGRLFAARITKTGQVVSQGKAFTSLSGAAKNLTGGSVDGWLFWKYRTPDGQWLRVNELRHP